MLSSSLNTYIQTEQERKTERTKDRQTDGNDIYLHSDIYRSVIIIVGTVRQTDMQTDARADRRTSRQTDRKTSKQTSRQTGTAVDRIDRWKKKKECSSYRCYCDGVQVAPEGVFERVLRPGAGRLAPSDGPVAGSFAGGEIWPDVAQRRHHLSRRRPQGLSRPAILLRLSLADHICLFVFLFSYSSSFIFFSHFYF